MKNNMVKKLLTLALAGAMTLSLAACGSKSDNSSNDAQQGGDESGKTYKVAIIKQLDHASLDLVMSALSNLENAQGRKVGVISHTDQIRSQISPQIRLVKQPAGGKSKIEIV